MREENAAKGRSYRGELDISRRSRTFIINNPDDLSNFFFRFVIMRKTHNVADNHTVVSIDALTALFL